MVLIALAALAAGGTAYEAAWADGHLITYEVVTYDPPCMALYVEYMEVVTRLTPLRDYNRSEVVDGIPMLIQVSKDHAPDTVRSLLERSKILSVQRVGPSPNGSDSVPWPVETNPNAATGKILSNCYVDINHGIEQLLRETIIREDSRASAISGAGSDLTEDRELIDVSILVNNLTSMRAYLEDNGADVLYAGSKVVEGTTLRHIDAIIPLSLVVPLAERDDFRSMTEPSPLTSFGHGGSGGLGTTHTRGITRHAEADAWHGAGYNGAGIGVGVIDYGFDGIVASQSAGEIPSNINRHCGSRGSAIASCDVGIRHGTQVAEIVMDMAPGADLSIGIVGDDGSPVATVVNWMVGQGVDVIVASVSPVVFEGPGNGNSYVSSLRSWLDAIDTAVAKNITWINAAGNENRRVWYAESPSIDPGNPGKIVFYSRDTDTHTENEVTIAPNISHDFVLRWNGTWHDTSDRPIDLDLHLICPGVPTSSEDDQDSMTDPAPIERIIYSHAERSAYDCNLVIESEDGRSPGWVQLYSDDANLFFTTGHTSIPAVNSYSLTNNAESDSDGMMAVGAVDYARSLKDYSSRGPTVDGEDRAKPEIVATTDVRTSQGDFDGTSAAAPHVAGLVALYQDLHDGAKTPAQVVAYMTGSAEQLGAPSAPNPNNVFGHGFARLPLPPNHPPPSPGGSAPSLGVWTLKDVSLSQGRSEQYGLFAYDPDSGDTLTVAATSSNTGVVTVTPGPGYSTTMRQSNNPGYWTGSLFLAPISPGMSTITVTVSDGTHQFTETFDVTVGPNHHPAVNKNAHMQSFTYPGPGTVSFSAEDADGDTLTWTSHLPSDVTEMSISMDDNVLTASPKTSMINTVGWRDGAIWGTPILTEVQDGNGGSDYTVVSACVTGFNVGPRSIVVSDQVVELAKSAAVSVSASDADGDRIVFVTPIPSDSGIASATVSGGGLSQLSTVSVGGVVTPLSVESMDIRNGTVVSATLSGQDSYGNTLIYALNHTNPVLGTPESITLASNNRWCPDREESTTVREAEIYLTGLSVGNTTVTLTVADPWGGSDTKNFTVTVLPAAPVITLAGQTNMTIPFNTTYVEPGYTATDREDGDITANVTVTGTVDAAKIGTYRLHYDVSDSSGNAAVRQVRTVHVADVTPPVITLAGQTNMTVQVNSTYADPGYAATDDYDGDLTGNVVVTGTVDTSTLGTYTIQYDVADSSGNAAVTQNRTVTVVADGAPPVITLKGQRAMTVEGGTIYVEPGYAATDDIDGNVTGMVVVTGMVDTTVLDTYTIYYDVSDSVGNAATTQNRTVTVVDTTPPILTLTGGTWITVPASVPYVDPGYEAIDVMDGNVTGRVNVVGTVNTDAQGLYKILYIVADSSGNLADALERNVIVADMTPPVITLKGGSEVWVAKGTAYAEPGYAATDNIDGNVTGMVVVTGTVDTNVEGTYVLHYDITDRAGNAAITQNRTVTVVAGDASPVITLKGQRAMTVEVRAGYVEPGYTATDHEDGNITANVTVTGTVDTTTTGTYRLYYDVSDSSGNHAVQQVRTIHVVDVTPPTITLAGPADMTVPVNSTYADPGYAATDDYDGDLTGNVTVTGTVDTTTTGTYRLYYDVSDSSGNHAVQQVRTVHVGDVTPPAITLAGPADMTIQVNSAYADPGYAAADDYDGDLTSSVAVTGTVDATKIGTYRLYYDVTDSSGNHAVQQVRTVHVVAATPPAIALSGPHTVTVPFGSTYSEPGYTATDPEDGDLTSSVVVTGTVDATKTGTYTLYYDVSDRFGNAAVQQTRIVRVVDVTPPTITLAGQTNMTVPVNTTYADPGYAAADDYDGDLTGSVTVTGTVDATTIGTYTIYYDVSDGSGNAAIQQVRTVHVEAIPDPQAGLPEVVKRYDTDRNGSIDQQEWARAIQDYTSGLLTNQEIYAISAARSHG